MVGIILGLLLAWATRVGAACLAGWGGFALGSILMGTVLVSVHSPVAYWIIVSLCAIIAAVLAFIIFDYVVIIATAAIGSLAVIRGIACYAGHYQSPLTTGKMIKEGLIDSIDPYYWIYVGGLILLFFLG